MSGHSQIVENDSESLLLLEAEVLTFQTFVKAFFFQLSDVEFPSVYCGYVLLPPVNEEVVLAKSLAQYGSWEIQTEMYKEEVDIKEMPF